MVREIPEFIQVQPIYSRINKNKQPIIAYCQGNIIRPFPLKPPTQTMPRATFSRTVPIALRSQTRVVCHVHCADIG